MKKITFLFYSLFFVALLNAQQRSCHTMDNHERLLQSDPHLFERIQKIEEFTNYAISSGKVDQNKAVITIPVVVHVVYNTSAQNVSDAQIQSQLDVLNKDFRKLNTDLSLVPSTFTSLVADAEINFCLANRDPSGNSTTGILRVQTNQASFSTNDGVKYASSGGSNAWPSNQYLNIWVCDLSVNNQDNLLGYAFPPYGHPSWTSGSWVADNRQGVVLHYKIVGRNNPRATGAIASANMGRCAVHEVGHFLGLRHIWADDQFSPNRCTLDDYIDDTPLQGIGAGFTCNLGGNTCIEPKNDMPDMFENYMDYATEACQNIFTKQQVSMMRKSITEYRMDLPIKVDIVTKMRIFDTIVYNDILIYPKSNTKKVMVEVKNEDVLELLEVQFFTMLGQAITEPIAIKKNETLVDTESWSTGAYVARLVRTSDGKVIRKQKLFVE